MALVPSPPLLIPELTGAGAEETVPLRSAALQAAGLLGEGARRWMALGADHHTGSISSRSRGTFGGFGVDVAVSLSPASDVANSALPLPVLIAGWLRQNAAPHATAEMTLVGADTSALSCAELGRRIRWAMDDDTEDWGLLVVGDGATTLTEKAPGSFDDRAEAVQNRIDDALAAADVDSLAELDRDLCAALGVGGWPAWQTLVGVVGDDRFDARTLYRGAPFGVGYFVGTWELIG